MLLSYQVYTANWLKKKSGDYDNNNVTSTHSNDTSGAVSISSSTVEIVDTSSLEEGFYNGVKVKLPKAKTLAFNPHFQHNAVCLETQDFPNAINQSNFPSCVLNVGETYQHKTVYSFRIVDC